MKSTLERLEDGSVKLLVTIPWEQVQKAKGEVLSQVQSTAKVAGFRKGKAPTKLVEETVDTAAMREDTLRKMLPETYIGAIQEHKLSPIMNPKIHVEKLEDGADWIFEALTCETPKVTLGKYKDDVKSITAKSKIAIPGKEQQGPNFDEVMQTVLKHVKVTLPKVLIEQEVDRLLSQTLNEIKSLGLTLDQYLGSTGKTPEKLREEYAQKAAHDITVELSLQEIANSENITVNDSEVTEAIQKAKDPAEKQHLEGNKYLLASILRQQKTLDFLKNL